jgi:hypothetical protein
MMTLHENVPARFALAAHLLAAFDDDTHAVVLECGLVLECVSEDIAAGRNMTCDVFDAIENMRWVLGGNAPDISAYVE